MSVKPTPLPLTESFVKLFLSAEGNTSALAQEALGQSMGIQYRNGMGELIYALVTCHPDISHAVVKCAQVTTAPHEIHYHALKHIIKYLYTTKDDGIYFWRQTPNNALNFLPHPTIVSSPLDLLLTN